MKRMKLKQILLTALIAVAILAAVAAGILFALSQNAVLNMNDVYSTLETVLPYFIPLVVLIVAAVALRIGLHNKGERVTYWVTTQGAIACILVLAIAVNAVCFGPMQSVINLALTTSGGLAEEQKAASKDVAVRIAEEGAVLLENKEDMLPLQADVNRLNVFGWASISPVYAGTGSGSVDTASCTDILKSLTNAGYELNTELSDFYKEYCAVRPGSDQWIPEKTLPEPAVSEYSDSMMENAKEFSDYALIVLSRIGGEDCDLPSDMSTVTDYNGNPGDFEAGQTYLELSKSEKEMITLVTENFDNVIVLVNSANTMELGWVEDYPQIKSVLWMAGAGQDGFAALGEIIKGDVNPSGRLVDIYAKDLTATPAFHNVGSFAYDNLEGVNFINYVEGIYVGYRFYETYYLGDEKGYSEAVQYPFGYGLSYTDFEQTMGELKTDADGNITVDVTVENTGDVAGKEVVQVYYSAPYQEGGIEKSAVELAEFTKTGMLAPGEKETVTVEFNQEDMASYDTFGEGCYVLEKGDYEISLRKNSHEVIDSRTYSVGETIVYNEDNKRSTDKAVAVNQFQENGMAECGVTYLSRANHFENLEEACAAPANYSMPEEYLAKFTDNRNYVIEASDSDEMPVTGAKKGVKLNELRGKDYDDPLWEDLLDELSISDMKLMIEMGGYQTPAVSSIGKVSTLDADGPAAFSSFFNSKIKGTAFPCATLIAATWNKDLARERGEAMGKEAAQMGVSGWYGPAMNTHRSPFFGRNFEYYSEDPVLAGKMAANEVAGAQSQGLYTYIKHFALNESETSRGGLVSWATEQAIREIYLKPFEMAVKEGGATAVMTSVTYMGTTWCGASTALLKNVLREEWGFNGMVITDFCNPESTFMNADICIRNGNDMMLSSTGEGVAQITDTQSATAVKAMRDSAHNILYTVANSNAYEGYESGLNLQTWMKAAIAVDVLIGVLLIVLEVLAVRRYKRKQSVTVVTKNK